MKTTIATSAKYGREAKCLKGEFLPPLLYSTELARSLKLESAAKVRRQGDEGSEILAENAELKVKARGAQFEELDELPVSTDLIYGLINVRTDGKCVPCAYMKEASDDFDIKVFRAGIDPT